MLDAAMGRRFGVCVAVSALTAGVAAAIGYVPTFRLGGGRDAVIAMFVGCGVSWIASCVGAVPIVLAASQPPAQRGLSVLMSTALRFLLVLVLVVPLVMSGWLDRRVFVLWVAISYLFLLLADSALAIRLLRIGAKHEA